MPSFDLRREKQYSNKRVDSKWKDDPNSQLHQVSYMFQVGINWTQADWNP